MKLYIGGPMRGIEHFNFPAFDAAAARLREWGHEVINPAEIDRDLGFDETTDDISTFDIEAAMHRDFLSVLNSDAIVLLPGWRESTGARSEAFVAETTGRAVFEYVGGEYVVMKPVYEVGMELNCSNIAPCCNDEVRVTNPDTGGSKGRKLARYDLIPAEPLALLAEHYGRGAAKYADRNWELGVDWSLNFAALNRHLWAFWQGLDIDPETDSPHLAAVAWHAFALMEYATTHPELDDRPSR